MVQRIEKIANGITFGPFQTLHFKKMVNIEFQTALFSFLAKEVVPNLTVEFDRVIGKVSSRFDQKRFLSPQSACKNKFSFEGKFFQNELQEEVCFEFIYLSKTHTIKPLHRGPHIYTIQQQEDLEKQKQEIQKILKRVWAGEKENKCFYCGNQLEITIFQFGKKPHVKYIYCPTNQCIDANFYGSGAGQPGYFKVKLDTLLEKIRLFLLKKMQ